MLLDQIDQALERIGEYKSHDWCDSDLDASLSAEEDALGTFKSLLFDADNDGALTEKGRRIVEGWAASAIKNADGLG